jgi:hypothetical protein
VATTGDRAHFVVHVPDSGPATVAGVPLPDTMVERLRAQARVEPVLSHDDEPILVGRPETALSEKTKLAPQGQLLLLGNPNHPAGLSLIDRDDLSTLATLTADHARAGPDAA